METSNEVESPTAEAAAVNAWTAALVKRGRANLELQAAAKRHAQAQREATAAHAEVTKIQRTSGASATDYRKALSRRTAADDHAAWSLAQLMTAGELYEQGDEALERARESYLRAVGSPPRDPTASYVAELRDGTGARR